MVAGLRVRLFGEVRAWLDDEPVDLGPTQQRAVFTLLVLAGGRLLSRDKLVAALWGDDPPRHAATLVQTHVMRLRRVLDPGRVARAPSEVLARSGDGYVLGLNADQVDALRFRQLVASAREAHRSALNDEVFAAADEALLVAQDPAAADLPLLAGHPLVAVLADERLAAAAWFAEAALRRGTPGDALAAIEECVAARPLDEPLHGWLMRLYAAVGRRVDALSCYERLRHRLVEELGVDPTPQLRELHQAVLREEDPALTTTAVAPPSAGPSRPAPRQLPAPPQVFTGRIVELADLGKVHDASTVVITAIDGMAGVGKTALAVQAAHHMVDRYPDGQLFIDLHGFTEGVAPVEPGEALDWMLRALGVPGEQIPTALDQRAGLYRSRLADQRLLIVLDNAATEAQVIPLLPGAPGCLVLVTSRRRLVGLDHTHTLSLDTLAPADAVALVRQTAGEDRLAGQPLEAMADLVELCGRLPLAIRIAAARLRSHPNWDLGHLVQRLRDQEYRLVELAAGQRSVTAALELSYQHLSNDLQRAYRMLGLHPGPDIDSYAAAALLEGTLRGVGRMLEQLLEAHLLQEPAPGTYRFHDLTRAHAAHTAARAQSEDDGRRALGRLLDYYRHTAAAAMNAAYPYERERRPQVPPAHTPSPTLPDPTAGLDWLDSQLPNLLAVARYASRHDRPAHLLHLSAILHLHLHTHGHYHDAETLHQQALTTARGTGDQTAEAEALLLLGHVHLLEERHTLASDHLGQALRLARTAGHGPGELDALLGLGNVHRLQGRYEQATNHYQQALQLARATGDGNGERNALLGLAWMHRMQGRDGQATNHYQRALQLAHATGHLGGEMIAQTGLGHVHRMQGRYRQATNHYQQALQLARATGHRSAEMDALTGLGHSHRMQRRYAQATDHYQRLLDLAHEGGSRNWQFEARQGFGRLEHAAGHPDAALTHHQHALTLATELGQPDDQARAHDGLAHAHHALHQYEQARTHWRYALDLLTRLGIDHTEDKEATRAAIRTHLADLDRRDDSGKSLTS